jgi:hypothetical protein
VWLNLILWLILAGIDNRALLQKIESCPYSELFKQKTCI